MSMAFPTGDVPRPQPPVPKTGPKPGAQTEAAAKAHPDFEKWEKIASEVEEVSTEDALHPERRAASSEDNLYQAARLYWLNRGIGASLDMGLRTGEHLKKPQELAKAYGVPVDVANQKVEDAKGEVEMFLMEAGKKGGWNAMKAAAEKEIKMIRDEMQKAA